MSLPHRLFEEHPVKLNNAFEEWQTRFLRGGQREPGKAFFAPWRTKMPGFSIGVHCNIANRPTGHLFFITAKMFSPPARAYPRVFARRRVWVPYPGRSARVAPPR
jgi:hypothetical protein